MSNLRNKIIRLAYTKPELRKSLLPLITKKAADPLTEFLVIDLKDQLSALKVSPKFKKDLDLLEEGERYGIKDFLSSNKKELLKLLDQMKLHPMRKKDLLPLLNKQANYLIVLNDLAKKVVKYGWETDRVSSLGLELFYDVNLDDYSERQVMAEVELNYAEGDYSVKVMLISAYAEENPDFLSQIKGISGVSDFGGDDYQVDFTTKSLPVLDMILKKVSNMIDSNLVPPPQ